MFSNHFGSEMEEDALICRNLLRQNKIMSKAVIGLG